MKNISEPLFNSSPELLHEPSLERGKILVIEDSVDQWYIIQKALKQVAPHLQPVLAMNSQVMESLLQEWIERQAGLPLLILVDLYLPSRQDGWNVLETLQSWLGSSKPIPVMIMSNSRDLEDIIDTYQYGVQSYIVKPNQFSDWLNCCRTLLGYLRK